MPGFCQFGLLPTVRSGSKLNLWYGIERDPNIASPDWTRIASSPAAMSLHKSDQLPVHKLFKPCTLNADLTVNYYLDPTNFSKKLDGSASDLTGTAGNVMSYQSKDYYISRDIVGGKERIRVSLYNLGTGWVKVPAQFYSCYEGKLVGTKLSSVSGVLPTTLRNETQFRVDARANGIGYEQQWYSPYRNFIDLFRIQFATNNAQKAVDYTLTAEGYCKGGLGSGVTTAVSTEWNKYNAYNAFIQTGLCNSLTHHWGEVSTVIANFGGAGVNRTFTPNRFLFVENVFGHIWKWIDCVTINHTTTQREVYIFDNPAQMTDNSSINARFAGLLPATEGWMKTSLFPDILPATVGGSSTTQYCDYNYSPALGVGWRALLCGGSAYHSADAGPFYAYSIYAGSLADALFGARLYARR